MINNLKSPNVIPLEVLYSVSFEKSIHLINKIHESNYLVTFNDSPEIIEINEKLDTKLVFLEGQASNSQVSKTRDEKYKNISKKGKIELIGK